MNTRWIVLSVVSLAALAAIAILATSATGVAQDRTTAIVPITATSTAPTAVVNARCPIEGTKLDPAKVPADLTREHRGQKVGFCCPACPLAWDKLTDAQKDAKLAEAMKPATAPATAPPGVVNSRCPIMGNKIDPANVPASLIVEYKGQKIGFCCPMCPPAWNKLGDADKDKKLAEAMKPEPVKAPK